MSRLKTAGNMGHFEEVQFSFFFSSAAVCVATFITQIKDFYVSSQYFTFFMDCRQADQITAISVCVYIPLFNHLTDFFFYEIWHECLVHKVNFIVSSSKIALSVRKPASAGISRGSCHAEGNETRETLY
jgi:hypothetical protein